ncbi:MAG TPA: acetyl-CoA carboxylase biotin carboxyl carrier protein subunit, partial [Dehalococcoidia bacterium]|nr:acetyl-CoA carboxylase biotin carboxyl carrier protein subunit [Dehalococcoidia bacterium]
GRLQRGGARSTTGSEGHLVKASMPGVVLKLLAAKGVSVRSGETVAILEAMKMEHQLKAPTDGIIAEIYVDEGDRVDEGALILSLGAPGLGVKSESEMPG